MKFKVNEEYDYKKVYKEFWKNLVENKDGSLNKDAVMRELSDYSFLMDQVPEVYMAVSGGNISKPNTYAFEVINEFEERYLDKGITQDDVEDIISDKDMTAEEKLEEIKNYLS